jgi:hypothetical protein
MEQREAGGTKGPTEAQGDLGHPDSLQISGNRRGLVLFNLAIDSKLRACDLVKIRVRDVWHGDRVTPRAIAAALL